MQIYLNYQNYLIFSILKTIIVVIYKLEIILNIFFMLVRTIHTYILLIKQIVINH